MASNKRSWRVLLVAVLVLAVFGLSVPGSTVTLASSTKPNLPNYDPVTCQMSGPNLQGSNVLNAVSVTSIGSKSGQEDIWAVGYDRVQKYGDTLARTLTIRYSKNEWQVVPSPNLPGENYLTAVSARALDDVWAVGYAINNGIDLPLVMHYDGKNWNLALYQEPTGVTPFGSGRLTSVTALSAYEVVVAGYKYGPMFGTQPLALYYNAYKDGATWRELAFTGAPLNTSLNGIAGSSINDLWAAATVGMLGEVDTVGVLYHFDGKSWNVTTKTPGTLVSVAATGDSVFAVGNAGSEFNKAYRETLAVVYDKVKGVTVRAKTINRDIDHNFLTAVTARGSEIYAVGYTGKPGNDTDFQSLVMRYDGYAAFTPIETPAASSVDRLMGVAFGKSTLWAVGDFVTSETLNSQMLILTTLCTTTPPVLASQVSPDGPVLVGHVTWQGVLVQPDLRQQRPVTLVLKLKSETFTYSAWTDKAGNFAVPVAKVPIGEYTWWAKGPNALANAGTVTLKGVPQTDMEMGLMFAGDADNNNVVSSGDFIILRDTFGTTDPRADFNNDGSVTAGDFTLLIRNFGLGGK